MNVVGDLSMQKHTEEKVFVFKEIPMLYRIYCHFITWICPILSNVFVPSRPMYWCIFRLYCWILPRKKCMTSWQEKSLLVCLRSSLSANPQIFWIVCLFPSSPLISSTISVLKRALHCLLLLFHFAWFSWLILWNLTREKNLPILCCNGYGHAGYYCSF